MKVFITHSAKDSNLIGNLVSLLRDEGYQVFVPSQVVAGENILSEITAAIRSADVLIAVVTSSSPNVFYELGLAAGASVRTLIAAFTGERLPADLSTTPFVQLTGDASIDAQNIVRRINELDGSIEPKLIKYETADDELRAAAQNPSILEALTPIAFEQLVMNLFQMRNYAASRNVGDTGVDFIIKSKTSDENVLVELKKTSRQSRISVETVRKFMFTVSAIGGRGLLIATAEFTAAALEMAVGSSIALRTLNQVLSAQSEEELLGTDSQGEAASLHGLAEAWLKKGNPSRAIEYYEKALSIFEKISDHRSLAATFSDLAGALARIGDADRAIEYFHRALDLYEKIGDYRNLAVSYSGLARVVVKKGDADRAIEYFHRALDLNEKFGDYRSVAASFSDLAGALARIGDVDRAIGYFHRALDLYEKTGDYRNQAASYSGLARVVVKKGDADRAIEYFHRALDLNEKIGDYRSVAASFSDLAGALARKGDVDRAIENFHKALEFSEKIGDHRSTAIALSGLARIMASKGNIEIAIEYYKRAAEMQQGIGDRYHLAMSLAGLASMLAKEGNSSEAIEYYGKAASMQRELRDRRHLYLTLEKQAQVAEMIGNLQLVEECNSEMTRLREKGENKSMDDPL